MGEITNDNIEEWLEDDDEETDRKFTLSEEEIEAIEKAEKEKEDADKKSAEKPKPKYKKLPKKEEPPPENTTEAADKILRKMLNE